MGWYFWRASEASRTATPAEPDSPPVPKLNDQAQLEFTLGQSVTLRIHNYGGPAYNWSLSAAPSNVQIIENTPEYVTLSGTIDTFLPRPSIDQPLQQSIASGQAVNLRVDNSGGAASSWSASNLPAGLSITEQASDYCVISGTVE